jgi:hypothetical protein
MPIAINSGDDALLVFTLPDSRKLLFDIQTSPKLFQPKKFVKIICGFEGQYGEVYSNTYPTRCNATLFILSGNRSTYFGRYHHPSLGAQTTVSTASGICHTVIAICSYRGRDGTGLSVLWLAWWNT